MSNIGLHFNNEVFLRIFRAIRDRRPFAAAIIGLLFGPMVVMGYLDRRASALAYYAVNASLVPFLVPFLLTSRHSIPSFLIELKMSAPWLSDRLLLAATSPTMLWFTFGFVGCLHGYLAARAKIPEESRKE